MREVVHVNIGSCGINIAQTFWKWIGVEHGIDLDGQYTGTDDQQLENIHVYYNEDQHKFRPRSIFIDLDPRAIDSVIMGSLGNLISEDSYIWGYKGTGNNWAKGYYTEGGIYSGKPLKG